MSFGTRTCITIMLLAAAGCAHSSIARYDALAWGMIDERGAIAGDQNSSSYAFRTGPAMINVERIGADRRGAAEFSLQSLGTYSHYYLEVSPWGVWSGIPATEVAEISTYIGNGVIDPSDYNGKHVGNVVITTPAGVLSGWYTPNGLSGYEGDSYLDVTSLVQASLTNNIDYLGFSYRSIYPTQSSGVTLRVPAILATNGQFPTSVESVPAPQSIVLFSSGVSLLVLGMSASKRKRLRLSP